MENEKGIFAKIPDELYRKFKIALFEHGKRMDETLAKLIQEWLERNENGLTK